MQGDTIGLTQEQFKKENNECISVFLGIDVHKKNWHVTLLTAQGRVKRFSQPAGAATLKEHLTRNFPGAHYYSVYEAGFTGFSTHRDLTEAGIENIIVNPADV